jgi:hypothetical protein
VSIVLLQQRASDSRRAELQLSAIEIEVAALQVRAEGQHLRRPATTSVLPRVASEQHRSAVVCTTDYSKQKTDPQRASRQSGFCCWLCPLTVSFLGCACRSIWLDCLREQRLVFLNGAILAPNTCLTAVEGVWG